MTAKSLREAPATFPDRFCIGFLERDIHEQGNY